jgi:hypothetical protein
VVLINQVREIMKVIALISIEVQIDLGEFDRKTDYKEIDVLIEQHKQSYKELLSARLCSINGNYDVCYSSEEQQQMEMEQNGAEKIRNLFDDKLEQQMNAINPEQKHNGVVSFLNGFHDDNITIDFLGVLDKPYIQGKVQLVYPQNWCFSDKTQQAVTSDVMINPTIADIMIQFNRMIELSGDHHHVFLESIKQIGDTNQYRISTGS